MSAKSECLFIMSKRNNISYIKPQDPSFLAKLKAQIGYKEGPTVDTKRQKFDDQSEHGSDCSGDDERPVREDEKPQIVVLKSGDLSADQVAAEEKRIAKEEAEKPADLSQPIVFKHRKQTKTSDKADKEAVKESAKDKSSSKSKSSAKQKAKPSTSKLSFNEDEEDDDFE